MPGSNLGIAWQGALAGASKGRSQEQVSPLALIVSSKTREEWITFCILLFFEWLFLPFGSKGQLRSKVWKIPLSVLDLE